MSCRLCRGVLLMVQRSFITHSPQLAMKQFRLGLSSLGAGGSFCIPTLWSFSEFLSDSLPPRCVPLVAETTSPTSLPLILQYPPFPAHLRCVDQSMSCHTINNESYCKQDPPSLEYFCPLNQQGAECVPIHEWRSAESADLMEAESWEGLRRKG